MGKGWEHHGNIHLLLSVHKYSPYQDMIFWKNYTETREYDRKRDKKL